MADPGLCRSCAESRPLLSGRGSTFWRCGVHDREPRVAKYPRLPVVSCPHFRARDGAGE